MGSNMNTGSGAQLMSTPRLVAGEFDLAFHDLKKDPTKNDKLVEFVNNSYQNSLNAPNFYSELNVNDPQFFATFSLYLDCLLTEHSKMKKTVKPVDDGFSKQLSCLNFVKIAISVFSTTAVAFCAAAVVYAVNTVPKSIGAAVAAAAFGVLISALARWGHSVVKKRESTVKKHKKLTTLLITGAELGIKNLDRITESDGRLASPPTTASLSEVVVDVEKAPAVKMSQFLRPWSRKSSSVNGINCRSGSSTAHFPSWVKFNLNLK